MPWGLNTADLDSKMIEWYLEFENLMKTKNLDDEDYIKPNSQEYFHAQMNYVQKKLREYKYKLI